MLHNNCYRRGCMPPKTKITCEMILEAGMKIIREEGDDNLNVRKIADALGCSTQPIMYQFSTVEKLKSALYTRVDEYHSEYLMNFGNMGEKPMLSIGLRYILFAVEEKNFFRFLFQSNKYTNMNFTQLLNGYDEGLSAIYTILEQEAGITPAQSREVFASLFISAHGLASLLANNAMLYDENYCIGILENVFHGVIGRMKGIEE